MHLNQQAVPQLRRTARRQRAPPGRGTAAARLQVGRARINTVLQVSDSCWISRCCDGRAAEVRLYKSYALDALHVSAATGAVDLLQGVDEVAPGRAGASGGQVHRPARGRSCRAPWASAAQAAGPCRRNSCTCSAPGSTRARGQQPRPANGVLGTARFAATTQPH